MTLNKLTILLDLLLVAFMTTYAIVVHEQHKTLSLVAIALTLVFILIKSYQYYRKWNTNLKIKTALYDAIALVNAGDFDPLPRIMDLCSYPWLPLEDYKAGMEVLEKATKNEPEKAIAAFSKALDKYYEATHVNPKT